MDRLLMIDEIAQAVLERGSVTKNELIEVWGIKEEQYKGLLNAVLSSKGGVLEAGPKGRGGFTAREKRRSPEGENAGSKPLCTSGWESAAVSRLQDLSKPDLQQLVGPLRNALRQLRREETGRDRHGTSVEFATALVLQHGIDLFGQPEIRKCVARRYGVKYPERWHPGKDTAAEFVRDTGFPPELAGLPTPDSLPDHEYLEGRFTLAPLLEFQQEVKNRLLGTLNRPGRRAILTLPTGAGKTRVAVESIREWLTSRYDAAAGTADGATVVWLAHTEELCEQACACFQQVWAVSETACPLLLVRFWGRYSQDLEEHRATLQQYLSHPSALVSTPQRMMNLLDARIQGSDGVLQDLRRALGLLVVDEAHRAAAPSYRRILTELIPAERPVSVAGLTATPFRAEYSPDPEEGTRELKQLFHALIEPTTTLGENPRRTLQEMRVLAAPIFETIETPTVIRIPNLPDAGMMSEDDLERIDRVLALRADNTPRRLAILKHLLPLANDAANSILYFGPSVSDAECMAFLLRREHVPAAVVSGKTREVTRRQAISEFKQGRVRVLCNCAVLTTGFDAPRVTHIVVARPTVSRVLYEQMLGRGLRGPRFGGTETCTILDCRDSFKGGRPMLGYECFRNVWQADAAAHFKPGLRRDVAIPA